MIVLCSTGIMAQSSSISGRIIDENEQSVAFATVVLFNTIDSVMVKAIVSDDRGAFSFDQIVKGSYNVQSSFVGYENATSDAFDFDGRSQIELPNFVMKENAQRLDDVTVAAKRPIIEVQPDKTVFNVEGSINAKGNTALELLRKSPGVVVDNNDGLILQGKSGVQVYIDGKRSPLSSDDLAVFLRNLQSDQIDAIEVITNPSSKYDAEGNAGIINIRLVKDKTVGTNGTANVGFRYGKNAKYTGSLNLNHRNKLFNVYGSYSLYDGENENDFWLTREQFGVRYKQTNKGFEDAYNHGFKLGADFFLNKKMTIGVLVNGNINEDKDYANSYTEIGSLEGTGIDSLLVAANNEVGQRNNTNYNINYVWEVKKGESLSIDLDHGRFRNDNISYQPNTYYEADGTTVLEQRTFTNNTPTDIDIYTGKLDYERSLLGGQFAVGLKTTNIITDNTFDFFDLIDDVEVKNTDRSNNFKYEERVNAAYASWQKQLNDRWNVMAGFRTEHTYSNGTLNSEKDTEDENVERNYFDYFPSAGLTYKMNDKNNFSVNYSRRIDRPNYQDLNPFEYKLDELTFSKGNPFLRPQYSNSYGITHTYKGTLSTSLNYTIITDVSTRITEVLDEKSAILSFVNLATQTNLALTVSYPFSVTKWWNVYATVTGYRLHNEANLEGNEIDLKTTAMNFYGQNTFTLPKGFKLEVSGWYNSPAIWAGNWTTDMVFDVSAGVSKKFFNDRGNLKVSISDIFFENGWGGESQFGELFITGGGNWESRQVRVNFSYAFGNDKVKKSRRRKTGMEEEGNRVGG